MTGANRLHIRMVIPGMLLTASALLSGCGDRPKEVLSEKKMVRLMADMELAEAYVNMNGQPSSRENYRLEIGRSVLAAHGVTQEQLDTTLAWYGRNLDDYTELYAKVDKEILARKKKLLNMTDEELEMQEGDILWKYGRNGVISDLGNTDSWVFSVSDPELQKGDRVQWSMHIMSPVQVNGVLGVEYEDGSSDASSSVFIGRNRLELTCQTDTGKTVKRVYGTMRSKDESYLPLFADSISVVRLPFDSMEYKTSRNIRHYGVPAVRKPKKTAEVSDSISVKDSISKIDRDVELKPAPPGKEKPAMWNGGERLTPARPADAPRRQARPVAPHEQGGVMNPVEKKKKK
ncbi:MAG: DUF4296 domain-containing protein [Muribaculaceae bacterium]|nr:DUF4296 domain-containing protein [Muribaculaceae bacterium]